MVTGGAGFIGSHLVDALLMSGADVAIIDDLSRGRRDQVDARAHLHISDIGDREAFDTIVAFAPDVVFHHAAQIDVRASMRDPLLDARINVLGTINTLNGCVAAGARRIVLASTGGAIYGDTDIVPTPEVHPAEPTSMYGTAKLAAEEYGLTVARSYPCEMVALRYSNVYGPRQDPHGEAGVVAILSEQLLTGRPGTITGDGRQTRDFVYVSDVVRANLLAAEPSAPPGRYNIGTGRETDINAVHDHLAVLCGTTQRPVHIPGRAGEQRRSCLDIRRAGEVLGWRPSVDLPTGLARTVDYFRSLL